MSVPTPAGSAVSPGAEFGVVFNELVALSEAAFATGSYEAAAHLLAAAVEVARHGGDPARLAAAGLLAADQRARLAELAPPHPGADRMADHTPSQPGGARAYQALETIMAYLQVLRAREHAPEHEARRGRE